MKKLLASLLLAVTITCCNPSHPPNSLTGAGKTWEDVFDQKTTCLWWIRHKICICVGASKDWSGHQGYAWAVHVPDRVCKE